MNTVDFSFLQASTLALAEHRREQLILVGCGGTGSQAAKAIAQVAAAKIEKGTEVKVTFVDPDVVKEENVPRQHFCRAEIATAKALALARRYSGAWGICIESIQKPFHARVLDDRHDTLKIIIGCVDNARARMEINKTLKAAYRRNDELPNTWWLDAGNHFESGQVLLGSTSSAAILKTAFPITGICKDIPLPSLQAPELIHASKHSGEQQNQMSCAKLVKMNLQALSLNARVASEVGDFLMRMLLTNDLQKMSTFFDLPSGTSRSTYLSPESFEPYLKQRRPNHRRQMPEDKKTICLNC